MPGPAGFRAVDEEPIAAGAFAVGCAGPDGIELDLSATFALPAIAELPDCR